MKRLFFLACIIISGCSTDRDDNLTPNSLAVYTFDRATENGAVIACAASNQTTLEIMTIFYPVPEAKNFRVFATTAIDVDTTNYNNFIELNLEPQPFFNGYLQFYNVNPEFERWLVVTFELDNEIKISNPIKSRQLSKPTVWNSAVTIDQSQSLMPSFNWENSVTGDTAIYFQVVSNAENNFLSGTYTLQNNFQYYKLDNVVLNITRETPPELINNSIYNFTLMDVSENNWVNLVSQKQFTAQ